MKLFINPNPNQWLELAKRKTVTTADLNETVKSIFNDIKKNGNNAVKKYSHYFDSVNIENFAVTPIEIKKAIEEVCETISVNKMNYSKLAIIHESSGLHFKAGNIVTKIYLTNCNPVTEPYFIDLDLSQKPLKNTFRNKILNCNINFPKSIKSLIHEKITK